MSQPVDRTEEKLLLLAIVYGRHPHKIGDGYGFAFRDELPRATYDTLQEAMDAEAARIRETVVERQDQIRGLNHKINEALTHIGLLGL